MRDARIWLSRSPDLFAARSLWLDHVGVVSSRINSWAGPHRTSGSDRHLEIEYSDTFSLLAELALGLGGFTGVAAAFGGRERAYSRTDQMRLVGILLAAGSVLGGCLAVLTFQSAGASLSTAYVLATLIAAFVLPPNIYPLIPHTFGLVRDPEMSTRAWVFLVVFGQFVLCLLLFVGNLIFWRAAWPLIAAFSVQLTYGLFLFARILTVRR